ncbi:MAG TPA: GntR family transcriptional regulator [Actinophytocola sp.]|uniref:GntR family transcriptional regulator n=1 Tax=Actinophytocola sp. TaxID=1872138 RepID=UPI002DB619C9|nr:GntR family transcriptional regulator [Actinophytocola sp.]HEU5476154.1 GntR family transcriptional regulator [Actinophytocola sp.]
MTPRTIGKAQRRGLAEEAADRIREAIFSGLFAPGAALREVELAEALDVSRGSVREGLAMLEHEGLLQSAWHRGTRVIDLTVTDIEEVYSVRAALERLATCKAAERVTAAELDRLDSTVAAMGEQVTARSEGHRLLALDIDFHDQIYHAAGNRRLLDAWQGLRSQVYLFQLSRIRLGDEDYRSRLVAEHLEIAALLRNRDTETLARVAEDHVHSARRALVGRMAGELTGRR